MKCNERNSCMGGYGKCLDIKLTNKCNAKCSFCIERDGYSPNPTTMVKLAEATNAIEDYRDVLILGGEPLLSNELEGYLSMIKPYKDNIYITTNGSLLNKHKAEMLSKYLTAINISIHHYSEFLNDKVYGIHIDFSNIIDAIKVFKQHGVKVRVNCNLVKGILDTKRDVENMISFAKDTLGSDEIRFNELQNAEELYVDARELFDGLTNNPYCDGCEKDITPVNSNIKIKVKMTCGIVNKLKEPITRVEEPKYTTKVVYPSAEVSNGWYSNRVVHSDGCHTSRRISVGGCHQIERGCH